MNFKYPWQKPYKEALLEFDPQELETKVLAAESAIFMRFQELAIIDGQKSEEHLALNDALHALRALQVDKLSYPTLPGEFRQKGN